MNTFLKTFFICLVLCLGFFIYKFVSSDSYSTQLQVSKDNPVFGTHEDKLKSSDNKKEVLPPKEKPEQKPAQPPKKTAAEKYTHTFYLFDSNGKLIPVQRQLTSKPSLKTTVTLLLKGPTIEETKKGIYSEIPANVDLISLKKTEKGIVVNLSSKFGNGGGSQSVENRVMQLTKTIKSMEPDTNVYLYINGEEVEYLGGDGVFIKQPLEL